jgi:hypothetical protein
LSFLEEACRFANDETARTPAVITSLRTVSQDRHFRAYGRRRVDLSASLLRPTHNHDEIIRIVDLSLAGACIEVEEPLSPGTRVRLEIVAPSLWDPVVVRCRTVWTGAPSTARTGLSFEHSDSALVFALFELLEAHAYEA